MKTIYQFIRLGFIAATIAGSASAAHAQQAELPLGQPLETRIGGTYVAEQFDDWQIRCVKQEEGTFEPCQMYQLLIDADGTSVAEITAFALPPGQTAIAGATIITPLETALSEGVQFFIDDSEVLVYTFDFCNQLGCYARMGFPPEMVEDLKNGAVATVRIAPFADPSVNVIVTASLRGFTAAFDWMQARLNAQQQ
jgi:invasion protein IalB